MQHRISELGVDGPARREETRQASDGGVPTRLGSGRPRASSQQQVPCVVGPSDGRPPAGRLTHWWAHAGVRVRGDGPRYTISESLSHLGWVMSGESFFATRVGPTAMTRRRVRPPNPTISDCGQQSRTHRRAVLRLSIPLGRVLRARPEFRADRPNSGRRRTNSGPDSSEFDRSRPQSAQVWEGPTKVLA